MNDALLKDAQRAVDRLFIARMRQQKFVILDDSGIMLTAVKLHFGLGKINVDHWCTAFYPNDVNHISSRYPSSVALGTVNGVQVFINNNELCAEREFGRGLERYSLAEQSPPEATSVLFVAYLRARSLGHIKDSN